MNLYKIMFKHFSENDNKEGILTYLVGESDMDVYEWLKSEPSSNNWINVVNCWLDKEEDNEVFDIYDSEYNILGQENFKDRMIRLRGDMNDEDTELSDLYYGATLYGWELVNENVDQDLIKQVIDIGINVDFIEIS
ncbi:hypothetical protein ASD24_24550 [Paenibacillus sp. Root52]|uniref:hypothetical protein n=1 Tax=Paenibacillus sp. Root52 TaxID=1736552 RepID=UPI0006F7C2D8|nr:hypothetical protein [Paenibacillus sp. Root52]KQY90970.1 hypothetical protein ASD24_24550 [Paenibacillus sp. Root52]